jgi:digeranylgeranylglycerophospholipid reductase
VIRGRFLIGADGPRSKVARVFGLSQNTRFLTGVEAEFPFVDPGNGHLHCFLDSHFAPGYLGWMVPGTGVRQIGLAFDGRRKSDLDGFIRKIQPITGMMGTPRAMRGGLILCGGRVSSFANSHVLLVGDAAGLVSPLTGGGIHTALHHGRQAALSVCDYLQDGASHPGVEMAKAYPRFRMKRMMRLTMGLALPNALYDLAIGTSAFRSLAQSVFFHARGGHAVREMETAADKRRRLHAA